jgi:hypothetical protein
VVAGSEDQPVGCYAEGQYDKSTDESMIVVLGAIMTLEAVSWY